MTTTETAPRPRIIERWFPCAEVSAASGKGWGSSNSETLVMVWFAKRPLAQSRAAVLCSLLPWPDDKAEQERVQAVIRESLNDCQDPEWNGPKGEDRLPGWRPHAYGIKDCARFDNSDGYNAARRDVRDLLASAYPNGASMLDPFSGRGLIPLEACRYGIEANAIDYSPVAVLASRLLIDWPFRDWDSEPDLPFDGYDSVPWKSGRTSRLAHDIDFVHRWVQNHWAELTGPYYASDREGEKPWGYLWASVIPCNECGRQFPLYGSNLLRKPNGDDPGQSFELTTTGDDWSVHVRSGLTEQPTTMRHRGTSKKNKLAWCPYPDCGHTHELDEHKALVAQHFQSVGLLVVADTTSEGKRFRAPTAADRIAAESGRADVLTTEGLHGLAAAPHELIRPLDHDTIRAAASGAKTFGDLSIGRQNLANHHLAATITLVGDRLTAAGVSADYVQAMTGYCGAAFTRKLKRSTRGATLQTNTVQPATGHIFINESSVGFNYDFFEVGIGSGPGSWDSVSGTPKAVERLASGDGSSAHVQRGSALTIPMRTNSLDAVVTDPPYDAMVEYSDASDLFYVWLRRALGRTHPDFAMTSDPNGVQEKSEEIIVKKMHSMVGDHRTPAWYESKIAEAFAEHARVVKPDGVVSIVFGHGDVDVWRRLLTAITNAGLTLTGAWPANTEKGGQAGSANINTTLTLACRMAAAGRPIGRASQVDAEVRHLVAERVRELWSPAGLSYSDQKMAAVGPAMEVCGRYDKIVDKKGQPVDLARYLPIARQAVTDAWDLRFDGNPLQVFDRRTQFALEWIRSSGRGLEAASEERWQRLAAELDDGETVGLLKATTSGGVKGTRFIYASEHKVEIEPDAAFVDVALAAAAAWSDGSLAHAAAIIRESGHEPDEHRLWATIGALSQHLPETDRDGAVWSEMIRSKTGVIAGVKNAENAQRETERLDREREDFAATNPALFEDPNSLFGKEGQT